MRTPRLYQTEAIVLKRSNLGETDRIVTLYTPHRGKIRAVAKGSRRPVSKLAGHLELFTHSTVLLASGRNLDIISQIQTVESFSSLRNDLEPSFSAIYVIELVDRFTEDGIENHPAYKLILDTLRRLEQPGDKRLALRFFDLHFLDLMGYRPQLQTCVHCSVELKPEVNYFSASAGGVLCPPCRNSDPLARSVSVNALKVMRHLQRGESQLIERLRIDQNLSTELDSLTRNYIRSLLDKDVKSAALLDTLRSSNL